MSETSTRSATAHEAQRLAALFLAMLLALVGLGARLHYIQVVKFRSYVEKQNESSMRRVRIPATRGRILARDGEILADSVPSYCIALYAEELRRPGAISNTVNAVNARIDELARIIGRPREIAEKDVYAHVVRRRPLPLIAWKGLSIDDLARLTQSTEPTRGVDVFVQPERLYPQGDCAAHVVGYVGKSLGRPDRQTGDADDEDFDFYLPDLVGREGVEKAFDARLSGRAGGELVRVDASGFKHESEHVRMPSHGRDVRLALNLRWQRCAEAALAGDVGAVVVMDCLSGEVVVLASSPRFNPAEFTPVLSAATWRRVRDDPAKPMLNRATQGAYPPGSIYKPFVGLAALNTGLITPETQIDCTGAYEVGGRRRLRCNNVWGHGPLDLTRAIAQSCNVYFCDIGVRMGFEPRLHDDSEDLGLGRRYGVSCYDETAGTGLLPSSEWKERRQGDVLRKGDIANISVGQGLITATPLQMAVATCAIANGGLVLRPRLVLDPSDESRPAILREMRWTPQSVRAMHVAMRETIHGAHGTGRRAAIEACELAGKTGTAEFLRNGVMHKHAWMSAFGPYENPRYVAVALVEDSVGGGRNAAPIIHEVFSTIFDPVALPERPHVPAPSEAGGSTTPQTAALDAAPNGGPGHA